MFCSTCGSSLQSDQRFCPQCGAAIPSAPAVPLPRTASGGSGRKVLTITLIGVLVAAAIAGGVFLATRGPSAQQQGTAASSASPSPDWVALAILNQRNKGFDAAVKSDLRNAATAEETYFTDNNAYAAQTPVGSQLVPDGFTYSDASNYDAATGPQIRVKLLGNTSYCLSATSASGTTFYDDSAAGGVTTEPSAGHCT